MTNGSTKLKITFSSSERDSSHERWVYSNLHDFVRHEVTEWDAASLGTWIFWAILPVRMLLTAFSSLVPFPLGVGPGGILCRELLTLGIPPFGWSKLDQPDSTPGSGGRHICSVWLAANRGFILGWVGERDFYVRRGFIVGWQGVASVKGGNHFSSLAESLTFCEAEFNLCMWVPRFLWRVSDKSMNFIDKLNNFREVKYSIDHRKMLQEKICLFHAEQLGSNNEGNLV